jgi:hypothetical protein
MLITPSLKVSERVRYTENGILSLYYGTVLEVLFMSDCIHYKVKWDFDQEPTLHLRCNLHKVDS